MRIIGRRRSERRGEGDATCSIQCAYDDQLVNCKRLAIPSSIVVCLGACRRRPFHIPHLPLAAKVPFSSLCAAAAGTISPLWLRNLSRRKQPRSCRKGINIASPAFPTTIFYKQHECNPETLLLGVTSPPHLLDPFPTDPHRTVDPVEIRFDIERIIDLDSQGRSFIHLTLTIVQLDHPRFLSSKISERPR